MTFDELWRLDLARQHEEADSPAKTGLDDSGKFPFPAARSDVPDEAEVDRYLQWLEEGFLQD
jgi:hypothetical protein